MSKEKQWLDTGFPIVMFEADVGWPSPRKQRLFGVACCRSIHEIFPEDPGWTESLNLAERVADRQAKVADLVGTLAFLEPTRRSRHRHNRTNDDMQKGLVQTAIRWACEKRRRVYAGQAAIATASAFAYGVYPPDSPYVPPAETNERQRFSDAQKLEKQKQIHLLRDICSDDFRPPEQPLGKLPSPILGIARSAYEERCLPTGHIDNDTLAVLSDALEEANLANAKMLEHLRSSGPHVRGCWALDLLLGKK